MEVTLFLFNLQKQFFYFVHVVITILRATLYLAVPRRQIEGVPVMSNRLLRHLLKE